MWGLFFREILKPMVDTVIKLDEISKPKLFSWENINFSVPFKKETKQLLFDVSGEVKSGEVIAIMGGSGTKCIIVRSWKN
jgi:ABC-type transport system involved in cytochrome bd biosynthesis fused ATPase/permease subunit